MNSPPLISILVPAYNHERYVETCVRSVLEQDWPRLELIVIDDGSRDGTWQALQGLKAECERRCERVVMQTQENQGTCVTGNRLYDLMRGEFSMTIASDDALLPDALSVLVKPMLQDPEVGAVVGQNVLMDDASRLCYWRKGGTVTYDEKEALTLTTNETTCGWFGIDQFGPDYGTYATLVRGNYIANGCLFRTATLNRVARFTPEAPLEDYWIHLQVSKVARYRSIPERTFRYRWHAGNTAKQRERMLALTSKTMDYEERLLRQAGDVRHLTDFLIARHPKRWETRWLKLRRKLGGNREP